MPGDLSGVDFTPGRAYVLARRLERMPGDTTHLHAWMKRLEAHTAFDNGGQDLAGLGRGSRRARVLENVLPPESTGEWT
jgi:hypothetical protein